MTDTTFTLRGMAETIGALDGRDAASTENLYQQLRGLSQRGLFVPTIAPAGRAKAAEFDLPTLCTVRLLMVLSDLGFDARTLREAHSFILKPHIPSCPEAGFTPATELGAAIEGIRAGEPWMLVIEVRRNRSTGARTLTGGFFSGLEKQDPAANQILNAWGAAQATVSLPATELLKPLLEGGATP